MKNLSLMLLAPLLLCGCPDSKMPKAPPLVPQPKAIVSTAQLPTSKYEVDGYFGTVDPSLFGALAKLIYPSALSKQARHRQDNS